MNDLDKKMCDIGNAYLNSDTKERLWFTAGSEWVNIKWCQVIRVPELYGLKLSGAEWKKTFADYVWRTLGFQPCVGVDENLYLKL